MFVNRLILLLFERCMDMVLGRRRFEGLVREELLVHIVNLKYSRTRLSCHCQILTVKLYK